MISVEEASRLILAGLSPTPPEVVPVTHACGRVLAAPVAARFDQPPARVSAMDGYAVRQKDVVRLPATLRIAGMAQAGRSYPGDIGVGEALRIYTGAALPPAADTIVLQEDSERQGEQVKVLAAVPGRHIRAAAADFAAGDWLLATGTRLDSRSLALAAAGGAAWLKVRRRPRVAFLANGEELVLPGDPCRPGQIVSSNSLLLGEEIRRAGGEAVNLGIAGDDRKLIAEALRQAAGCDLIVTIGGASVGDFDLIGEVLHAEGLRCVFTRVALRPGKPTAFGYLGPVPVLTLPGNPVSVGVTACLFLRPMIAALLGLADCVPATAVARLGADLRGNDSRADYLRGRLSPEADGLPMVLPFSHQDSALLRLFAAADCLIVRPPLAPPLKAGAPVPILPLP